MTGKGLPKVSARLLEREVQSVLRGISSKYVPEPSIEEVSSDALIGLKRFRQAVRSKALLVERLKEQGQLKEGEEPPAPPERPAKGLGTKLPPSQGTCPDDATTAAREVECFLEEVERMVLRRTDKFKESDTRKHHTNSNKINSLMSDLRQRDDLVLCPTDKTNSCVLLKTDDLKRLTLKHLEKDAVPTTHTHLKDVQKEARAKLDTFQDMLSENEYNYIKQTINKASIPTVQLLVKDHKDKDSNGDYPTRLVVPAKNFTAGFPHVGQHGIRQILDRNKIDYSKKTIIQASDLKNKLEKLTIKRSDCTIILFDVVCMYPSVKFNQIESAVNYFLRDAPQSEKDLAKQCLEMVKFWMSNTLIQSMGQYYEYGGSVDVEAKGLTIGGYESAFFADLVAAWLLENTVELMLDTLFDGLYQDDGILIFNKPKTTVEVCDWLTVPTASRYLD